MYWTTNVNGSAYGEYILAMRLNQKLEALTYYTIETGVGAGTVLDSKFIGTLGHPEIGHVRLKRHPDDLSFKGICPYHGDCLEGLVAGPTFEARLGKKGQDIPLTDRMGYYGLLYCTGRFTDNIADSPTKDCFWWWGRQRRISEEGS